MPKAGECRVCARPDCERVNARLRSGESERGIALEIGIPRSTLKSHRERCMRGRAKSGPPERQATAQALPPAAVRTASPPLPAVEPLPAELVIPALPEGDPRTPILTEMARQYGELDRALVRAQAADDDRGVATVVQQMRGLVKQHADIVLRGWRPEPPEVERVLTSPLIHRVFRLVADALLPHPEAREAVVAALRDGGVDAEP